jgi:hypothetical protein
MNPDWITYKGKRILHIDYSVCENADQGYAVIDRAKAIYQASPVKLDVFTNCTTKLSSNPDFTKRVNELGAYAKSNEKVNKRAIIGIDGLKMVFFRAYQMATKDSSTMLFKTKEEALEWLVS